MTHTEATDWAIKVTTNFGRGYTDEQVVDVENEFECIDGPAAERLYAHLKLSIKSSFKVGIKEIREAKASLGIGSSGPSEIPQFQTVKWYCQACNRTFNFNELPEENDEYREIFNFCPHCGFVPRVILHMEGTKVTYIADKKMMDLLASKPFGPGGTIGGYLNYYKTKKGEFFDKVKERDSALKMYKEKGIDDEYDRLVEHTRYK